MDVSEDSVIISRVTVIQYNIEIHSAWRKANDRVLW